MSDLEPAPRWFSVTVDLSPPDDLTAELVADAAWDLGAPAVEERASPEVGPQLITGFPTEAAARTLAERVSRQGWGRARVLEVTDDGLDSWRDHARVELAPPFALVPAWGGHHPPGDGSAIPMFIDPGRTFGSGSHPTTRLVLSRLADLVRPGDRVLDVGCGSGVLAVGAAMLGCWSVGVDIDPAAAEVSVANAVRNQVADRFRFDHRTLPELAADITHGEPRFEVVVANLLAPVVRDLAPDLAAVVAPGGSLVVSGLLADRWEPTVALFGPAMEPVHVDLDDQWVAVTLR